jgi:hypothetical protein
MSIDTREPLQSIAPGQLAAAVLAGNENPLVKAMGMWLEHVPAENLYRELGKDELNAKIWNALDGRTHIHRTKQGNEERALAMGTRLTADVTMGLVPLTLQPGVETLPFWHGRRSEDPDPRALLPVKNGLLNWRTGQLLPPTARFVSTGCSAVAFDPQATTLFWDFFLEEVFDGDLEQIDLLHEVLGCIITGQTKFQKVFQLFGPGRSGKGP